MFAGFVIAARGHLTAMAQMKNLTNYHVAVLATDGFEQAELEEPVRALKAAGARISVVAPRAGKITGFNHHDKGRAVDVDETLSATDSSAYDALLMPGGALNADQLRAHPAAVAFAKSFFDDGKPVAAICHAFWTLIESGVIEGRTMTSWPSIRTDITNAGGNWVDREVNVDGRFVSSRKPEDISAFNEAMLAVFAEAKSRTPAFSNN